VLTWRPSHTFYVVECSLEFLPPVLYVIILSAALDLVPASTPKGLIAFCNIAPSFAAKVCWPYFLKGTIRYNRRVVGCCIMSMLGMIVSGGVTVAPQLHIRSLTAEPLQVVALSGGVGMRLLGIGIASFSSGSFKRPSLWL
jgi:battenin